MKPIKIDFAIDVYKDNDYNKRKIIGIQKIFEEEGSFLGSEKIKGGFRIIVDYDKSPKIQQIPFKEKEK
jgi:hypothetical protein